MRTICRFVGCLAALTLLAVGARWLWRRRQPPFDPARPSHPWGTRTLTIDEEPVERPS